jgi:hypothetical protein
MATYTQKVLVLNGSHSLTKIFIPLRFSYTPVVMKLTKERKTKLIANSKLHYY